MTTETDTATEGAKIAQSYNRALEEIRRHPDLSDEAKRRKMAVEFLAAKKRMASVRESARENRQQEIGSLQEELLDPRKSTTVSPAADRVTVTSSYRDALARAATCDGTSDLIATMERAMRVGDDLQARACLTIALERSDLRAINHYADTHPGTEPKLQRLLDLTNPGRASSFGAALHTTLIAPPELDRMADYQLEQLINSGG